MMNSNQLNNGADNFEAYVNQDMFLDDSIGQDSFSLGSTSPLHVQQNILHSSPLSPQSTLLQSSTSPNSWLSVNQIETPKLLPALDISPEEWTSLYHLGLLDPFSGHNSSLLPQPALPVSKGTPNETFRFNSLMPSYSQVFCMNSGDHKISPLPAQGSVSPLAESPIAENQFISTSTEGFSSKKSPPVLESAKKSVKTKKKPKSDFHPIRNAYTSIAAMPTIAPRPGPSDSRIYVPLNPSPITIRTKDEPSDDSISRKHSISNEPSTDVADFESARQQALSKRQERLIKNRAAALMSRKRKREQVVFLETENDRLSEENVQLKNRVQELELLVQALGGPPLHAHGDMQSLQSIRVHGSQEISPASAPIPNQMVDKSVAQKSVNVIFMIFFFSFAIFSSPVIHSTFQPQSILSNEPKIQYRPGVVSEYIPHSPSTSGYSVRQSNSPSSGSTASLRAELSRPVANAESSHSAIFKVFESKQPNKKQADHIGLYNWINRSIQRAKQAQGLSQEPSNTTSFNVTDLIPFTSDSDITYIYSDALQNLIPKNSSQRKSQNPSGPNMCSKMPQFALLSPWIEEPGSSQPDDRFLRIDVQVVSSSLISSTALLRHG